ncbi:hypothetical protein [Floricoccus penangensis]|uniref:hypothetical protein n=1 Tax=Floricoccus penangensis TaxID=1859475 RepID=UPI0026AFEEC6
MAIACNALPNVICGYLPTFTDAFLFGRINNGNCASLPLGLNYGWAGELNIRFILEKLFEGDFNTGYPSESATRKKADANLFLKIKEIAQKDIIDIFKEIGDSTTKVIFEDEFLMNYILEK